MMKKLGMFAFVMALVVAFALPAFAGTVECGEKEFSVTIGGYVMTLDEQEYQTKIIIHLSAPGNGGGKDQTRFFMGVPFWSYMYILVRQGSFSGYAGYCNSRYPGNLLIRLKQ